MKKVLFAIGLFVTIFGFTYSTYAYNQHSGSFKGPHAQIDVEHSSSVYALSSASAPVYGTETEVYFSSFGWLHSSMESWANREARIKLMEQDDGNEDDYVKGYTGRFQNLHLNSVVLSDSNIFGEIDASSDATAELYLTLFLTKTVGDSSEDNNEIFYSDIRVN